MRPATRILFCVTVIMLLFAAGCSSRSGAPAPDAADSNAEMRPDVQAAMEEAPAHQLPRDPRYPDRWWQPVSKDDVPDWEILPQEAGPGEVILSKRQPDLGLLSNFAATPFKFHGKQYASLEGFWQALKYPEGPDDPRSKFPGIDWKYTREQVEKMTGFDAKHAGDLASDNMQKMGINWVTFEGRQLEYKTEKPGDHYLLIVAATREKVRQNPDVQRVLLQTGDLRLLPDHHQEPNAPAAWQYYNILMAIRSQLQHGQPLPADE